MGVIHLSLFVILIRFDQSSANYIPLTETVFNSIVLSNGSAFAKQEEIIQIFAVDFLTKLHRHDSYIFIQSPLQDANPTAADAAKQKSHDPVVKTMEDVRPHPRSVAASEPAIFISSLIFCLPGTLFLSTKLFSFCLTVIS